MRLPIGAVLSNALTLLALLSCQAPLGGDDAQPKPQPAPPPRPSLVVPPVPMASPSRVPSDEVLAVERSLQARLPLPPRREHVPRLAFGKGVVGQLTTTALRVYSTSDASLLVEARLEAPRAVVALADGALLAVGASALLRVEGAKAKTLPRPIFLPGAELYADAMQADRIWIFEGRRAGGARPTLSSFRLASGEQKLLLPEQVIELEGQGGGIFGTTREGVWLYFGEQRVQRFGPGGARLPGLAWPRVSRPFVLLPTRRLDQAYLLSDDGRVTRALVTPIFRELSAVDLGLVPFAAEVGNEGRLLAVIAVSGAGPRFELRLFDEQLQPTGRAALPAEEPTGRADWVQVVTRHLEMACAPRDARVAVGGPERVLIFDGEAKQVLSIPSR
jgi:hypothetical protein